MHATVVNPPATAARPPDAMSSLYSWPGSRRWVCRSTKPGATHSPCASITSAPGTSREDSTAATRPSSIRTSAVSSRFEFGSSSLPLRIKTRPMIGSALPCRVERAPGKQVENGHAQGDAVADLVENHARPVVREVVGQLYAAIHRSWMHHNGVVLRE